MEFDVQTTTLLCPKNDEESLQILKLAQALGLATVVSGQPHGARLEKEKDLLARVMEANPNTSTLVIVEIPGPREEEELTQQGLEVVVIDHHRYDDIDRMQEKSSIEQFCELFDLTNDRLTSLGFDPKMIAAVGAIDRGFLWELKKEDLTEEERQKAIVYYRGLGAELGGERREREAKAAQAAWEHKEEIDGVLVVRSAGEDVSIRDAVSFLVAEQYPEHPPQTLIWQGNRRVYVQESPAAKALHDAFGGFTFGRDHCWGKLNEGDGLPSQKDILSILKKNV